MCSGISVVICCHNSAKLLPETLNHLLYQDVDRNIKWEVIVVDNGSTDDTSNVAINIWPDIAPAKLKVISELELGAAYARNRGLKEANYDIVSLLDHDNWVSRNWLQTVFEVMNRSPEIGACGGYNDHKCEIDPPWWFENYKDSYAVGPQGSETGDITDRRGYLWGAGLTVRKVAWTKLQKKGYKFFLPCRKGDSLSAGGDSELCFALRLSGWRLWYDSKLRLTHYISSHRLNWNHLRALHRGFGASTVALEPYLRFIDKNGKKMNREWKWEFIKAITRLLSYRKSWLNFIFSYGEGDPGVLAIERILGRITELLRNRYSYDISFNIIKKFYNDLRTNKQSGNKCV
jgi:glycosyltransferase involved in cell wall biosynthesis